MKNHLPIAILLALLCFCGSGCFTTPKAISYSKEHFHDEHRVNERTAAISDDGKHLDVNITMTVLHKMGKKQSFSNKSLKYRLPLKEPPAFAGKYILEVQPDENCKRADSFALNINRTGEPCFFLKRYESKEMHSEHHIKLAIHPDEMPELYKPFVYHNEYYDAQRGHRRYKTDLMIPYQRDGNIFFIYSAATFRFSGDGKWCKKIRRELLLSTGSYDTKMNAGTLLCYAVTVPFALVFDIVTLPFKALWFADVWVMLFLASICR